MNSCIYPRAFFQTYSLPFHHVQCLYASARYIKVKYFTLLQNFPQGPLLYKDLKLDKTVGSPCVAHAVLPYKYPEHIMSNYLGVCSHVIRSQKQALKCLLKNTHKTHGFGTQIQKPFMVHSAKGVLEEKQLKRNSKSHIGSPYF